MAHSPKIVDLIGLHSLHDASQVDGVTQFAVVQHQTPPSLLVPFIEMIDALRIER